MSTDVGGHLLQQGNNPAITGNVNYYVDYNSWTFFVDFFHKRIIKSEIKNFRSLFKPQIHYRFAFTAVQ
jgi:hypothetical protein